MEPTPSARKDALVEASALHDAGEHALALECLDAEGGGRDRHLERVRARALFALGRVDEALASLRDLVAGGADPEALRALATLAPLAPACSPSEVLRWRRGLAARLALDEPSARWPRPPRRSGEGPLRVGLVSAFFHRENYMKPVWTFTGELPRDEVELHLFSDAPVCEPWTGYVPHPTDRIHATDGLSVTGLATAVRDVELDVLVDLNGFSAPERLPLFCAPHAPLVATWFNAFATSGLPGVDLILGDAEVCPTGEEPFFSERVVRLPTSYLAFTVGYQTPPVSPPPSLDLRVVTFGCFAPLYKVTPAVLDGWAEILRATPASRLLVANRAMESMHNRAWLLQELVARGVRTGRVEMEGPAEHRSFLARYDRVDVALDTFPYSGGSTTMEALWQGVPVLALEGDRWGARTSRTLLRHAGLDEWVLPDVRAWVRRAVELAGDPGTPGRLSLLREGMRSGLAASRACDGRALAVSILRCFREQLEAGDVSSP